MIGTKERRFLLSDDANKTQAKQHFQACSWMFAPELNELSFFLTKQIFKTLSHIMYDVQSTTVYFLSALHVFLQGL